MTWNYTLVPEIIIREQWFGLIHQWLNILASLDYHIGVRIVVTLV